MKRIRIVLCALLLCILPHMLVTAHADYGVTRIHILSLDSGTDAILLESGGHFGLVDSGEDWDYPTVEDTAYVNYWGITVNEGFEQQVIHYLKKQGVHHLDFYIATHAHSDHIGSADEIMRAFPTDRLYIQRYDETALPDHSRRWDNQYVYDQTLQAAREMGVQIITDLDVNTSARVFRMGDMSIELLNCDRRRNADGSYCAVSDENENAMGVFVTAFGRTALLASDLDPAQGATGNIAEYLSGNAHVYENTQITESRPGMNTGYSLDLLKMSHHGNDINNTTYFLTTLQPKNVVITGWKSTWNSRMQACVPNAAVYATRTDSAAITADFSYDGLSVQYTKLKAEWDTVNEKEYFFDTNGRLLREGISVINGKEYLISSTGEIVRTDQWVPYGSSYRYWDGDGYFRSSEWITENGKIYYLNESGLMVRGWLKLDGIWYGFHKDGTLASNEYIEGYYVDNNGIYDPSQKAASWKKSGGRWWYRFYDGKYPANRFVKIDGEYYYFDKDGWMVTGWKQVGSKWYWFKSNGVMAHDCWQGSYYLDSDGVWSTDSIHGQWKSSNGKWWYRHSDGSYSRNSFEKIDNDWYYFDSAGWMVTGWKQINGNWYVFSSSGKRLSNCWYNGYWLNADGVWVEEARRDHWVTKNNVKYYQYADGSYAKNGWFRIEGYYYYLDTSGAAVTGWKKIDSKWYYFKSNGQMQKNCWIDNYWLNSQGVWVESCVKGVWKSSGGRYWYRHEDGSYTKANFEQIENGMYYFDSEGWQVTGWQRIGNKTYYFADNGVMAVGWKMVGEHWYHFNDAGELQKDCDVMGVHLDEKGRAVLYYEE